MSMGVEALISEVRATFLLLVARSERSVAIADEPSSTYACFGVYAEQAARARKERRYDLKKGRFSLQSDEGRVWSSRWVWATFWGVGGLLCAKHQSDAYLSLDVLEAKSQETDEGWVATNTDVPKSAIVAAWTGEVYDHSPGYTDLRRIGSSDEYKIGSRSNPTARVAWRSSCSGVASASLRAGPYRLIIARA
jgi:hypothetical protein